MANHPPLLRPPRQRGVALITTLILLVMMTVIAVTAARMGAMEERMAGGMRDRDIALRAAEMGLRDAERDILGWKVAMWPNRGKVVGLTGTTKDCSGSDAKTFGLCYGWDRNPQTPTGWSWPAADDNATSPALRYGRITGASAITNNGVALPMQPRYLIEGRTSPPVGGVDTYYYRITVRAHGQNPNTVVWLQEVFAVGS